MKHESISKMVAAIRAEIDLPPRVMAVVEEHLGAAWEDGFTDGVDVGRDVESGLIDLPEPSQPSFAVGDDEPPSSVRFCGTLADVRAS